jgi:hypothetical protein
MEILGGNRNQAHIPHRIKTKQSEQTLLFQQMARGLNLTHDDGLSPLSCLLAGCFLS